MAVSLVQCIVALVLPMLLSAQMPGKADWNLPKLASRSAGDLTNGAKPTNRIIGGVETSTADYPFLVSVQTATKGSSDFLHICGGSIYNENFIITAAHCVQVIDFISLFDIRIIAGDQDLNVDSGDEQIVSVKEVTVHPDFSPLNFQNDIALLELETPLSFNARVGAIQVDPLGPTVFADVTILGWGSTWLLDLDSPNVPFKADLQVFPNWGCSLLYSVIQLSIADNQFCAGLYFPITGGKGACHGDTGGPLITATEPPRLLGIASWGIPCVVVPYPQVFTRMSLYSDFLSIIAGSGA